MRQKSSLLAWTVLFINIYTAFLIESEEIEYCPVTHSPTFPTAVNFIIISYHSQTDVCDSANYFELIDIGWRIRGWIQDWALCGRYSGRYTDVCEAIFWPRYYIFPFPFLVLQLLCHASQLVAVLFSFTIFLETFWVLPHTASSYGGGTCSKPCRRYSMY